MGRALAAEFRRVGIRVSPRYRCGLFASRRVCRAGYFEVGIGEPMAGRNQYMDCGSEIHALAQLCKR